MIWNLIGYHIGHQKIWPNIFFSLTKLDELNRTKVSILWLNAIYVNHHVTFILDAESSFVEGGGQPYQLFNVGLRMANKCCPQLTHLNISGCGLVSNQLIEQLDREGKYILVLTHVKCIKLLLHRPPIFLDCLGLHLHAIFSS